MKRFVFFLMVLVAVRVAQAQRIAQGPLHSEDDPRSGWLLPGDTIYKEGRATVYGGKPVRLEAGRQQETLPPPVLPTAYGWGLRQGLNVSVDLSAFATFGKNVPYHGGWGQHINATYVTPLSRDGKLWLAGGGYLSNVMWGGDSYRDAGLYAMLGYKISEKWEVYAYGQLSLANNYDNYWRRYYNYGYPYRYGMYRPGLTGSSPMGYGMGMAGVNVIGAGVKYNVSRNLAIGFEVEGIWYNNNQPPLYFDRYNYPLPEL